VDDCKDCSFGSTRVTIDTNEENNDETKITLTTDDGIVVGTLVIPNDILGNGESSLLEVAFITNFPKGNIDLGNSIVDIKITDGFGNQVTELSSSIDICLADNNDDADDGCLSFFNTDTGQWECEDKCLKKEGDEYCGNTDHLTSFALLLSGGANGGGGDPCDSDNTDYILAWISLGFVAFAICCIILALVFVEFKYRKQRIDQNRNFNRLTGSISKHM